MCDPITASLVVAGVSTAVKIGGDIASASAQNQHAAAVKSEAIAAEQNTDYDLSIRSIQEKIAGSQKLQAGDRQAAAAEGSTRAGAAGAGVGGMTVDLLLSDQEREKYMYDDSVTQQTAANVDQLDRQKDAAYAEEQSRIAGAPPANPWATALRIGGDAASGAGQLINIKNPSRI